MDTEPNNINPNAPKDTSPKELGFHYPQKMVNWFSPRELLRAGVQSTISSVFGSYADKREIQALQSPETCNVNNAEDCTNIFTYSDLDEITIDYIADLGDGWNSTYTMASLLAEPQLDLTRPDGSRQSHSTERGSVLIMGGDQVYPTASKEEYRNRLWGPYESALPQVPKGEKEPDLFAIPGNHDWYDGLTSFSRLFFQGRSLGAWKTKQNRSYFALQLPHGWWLWGIDTQLNADLDLPQINFFKEVAAKMPAGSQIITCVPEPEWILSQPSYLGPDAYDNLHYIETKVIEPAGHDHTVSLAGDLHAYSRYQSADKSKQRIMAGGGGAYLHATHKFPNNIELPKQDSKGNPEKLELAKKENLQPSLYPSRKKSRQLSLGALLFPLKAKSFSCIFGVSYLIIAWFIHASSLTLEATQRISADIMTPPTGLDLSIWNYTLRMINSTMNSPIAVLAVILFFLLCYLFTQSKNRKLRTALSVVHVSAHLFVLQLLVLGFALLNQRWIAPDLNDFLFTLLFSGYMVTLGTVASGLIIGLYIYLSHFLGHTFENEVLGCQAIPNYKNFLRLNINKQGDLTIYPVGVNKVAKKWQLKKQPKVGEPIFSPTGTAVKDRAHLIEDPIVISNKNNLA